MFWKMEQSVDSLQALKGCEVLCSICSHFLPKLEISDDIKSPEKDIFLLSSPFPILCFQLLNFISTL